MAEPGSIEALTQLKQDLLALSQARLRTVNELFDQLENHIEEFKKLLDKPPRKTGSRQALTTGKINLRGEEYEVNQEFQQGALQLADALELDEIEAAQLFLDAQGDDAIPKGRSVMEWSIIRFHNRREILLDCLKISLDLTQGIGPGGPIITEDDGTVIQKFVASVLNAPQGSSQFIRKCLSAMADCKKWLHDLTDKINSAAVLGQSQSLEYAEVFHFERLKLVTQHELLGVIVYYLVKSHSGLTDLEYLLNTVKSIDKYDNLLVHYIPAIGASFQTHIRPGNNSVTLDQIRPLHDKFFAMKDDQSWPLHYFYSAVSMLWLVEYVMWYEEGSTDPIFANVNIPEVRHRLFDRLIGAIREGAFDFIMSMCVEVKPVNWQDPAQHEISEWIDHKSGSLSLPWQRIEYATYPATSDKAIVNRPIKFSMEFEIIFMEQLEMFIDMFTNNAPNVLRKLRHDEDEKRQLGQTHDHDMHLEKFLVIISFAFEGRTNAALQAFWSDPDSHMYGFVVWASHRASTPLASAFNGMLRSISGDPECADAAHKFLLDESTPSSGQMQTSQRLSWRYVLGELRFFTNTLNQPPALLHANFYRTGKPHGDQDETDALALESSMMLLMLQSYLHLITRLCSESSEARIFLLQFTDLNVVEELFKLASIPSPRVPSGLRGCLFNTLESLSRSKSLQTSFDMWSCVDRWRTGAYFTAPNLPKASAPGSTFNADMNDVLRDMEMGFEQTNSFVRLLNSLVSPAEADELNDLLPFPEHLGSSSRMPGVHDYVDFVMRLFKTKTYDKVATKKTIEEFDEMRVLRWSCLDFISTCLGSFNEDLLLFAEHSHIQIGNSIRTSSLENYIRLHPFTRVMEWLFNDSVMEALFAAVEQDVDEVCNAEADSPLIYSLIAGIGTIIRVLYMQQIYLNRVRPALKNEKTYRRMPVSNAAYSSFEDGILKHLSIISNLGQYCIAFNDELTLVSLKLLEKLSTSSKLVSPTNTGPERGSDRNKAMAALGQLGDAESISNALIAYLRVKDEVDDDSSSTSYIIKANILRFLNTCIESSPNRPTVAHLLLGFECKADGLHINPNSPLAQNSSLFHEILLLAVEFPAGITDNQVSSALITIKSSCLRLVTNLWISPLSSGFMTEQLRLHDFLTCLVLKEFTVKVDTLWDGRLIYDPEFMYLSSATALTEFLLHRASVFKTFAIQLRLLAGETSPTMKQRIVNTLLGSTMLPGGQHMPSESVFALFDFMEIEVENLPDRPVFAYLENIDLWLCHESHEGVESFNVEKASELIALRCRELEKAGKLETDPSKAQFLDERNFLLAYIVKMNHLEALRVARSITLQAWVNLMCMITQSESLGDNKMEFVLQSLQLILPKLEKYSTENAPGAVDLARLAKASLFSLDFGSRTLEIERKLAAEMSDPGVGHDMQVKALERRRLTEVADDRLFSLFRISLRAIHTPSASATFKQIFYSICYRYLTGLSRSTAISSISQRRQSMKSIILAGDRLLDILCSDAYAGEQECRISALLMLSAMVTLARQGGQQDQEDSKNVIEPLERFNFVGIMVDSIQNMPKDLRDNSEQDTASQIVYCKTKLSLLLQIAQTRYGAALILNARLFQSVKNSGLFAVDPDLGLDLAVPDQEKVYYQLLLAIMRIVNACVVSRGAQNEHTLSEGRKFLLENRGSIMTIMKKHAGIGAVDQALELDIGDLAESYMVLMSVTDFLKDEEKVIKAKKPKVFT